MTSDESNGKKRPLDRKGRPTKMLLRETETTRHQSTVINHTDQYPNKNIGQVDESRPFDVVELTNT